MKLIAETDPGDATRALERTILRLLDERAAGKTICPSDAARAAAAETGKPEEWKPLMEPVRAAARQLVAEGRIVITQGGRVVDPCLAKGPIRLCRVGELRIDRGQVSKS